jgi:hypothetical protein
MTLKNAITARGGGTTPELERVFGKFRYTNNPDGTIKIRDTAWVSKNIISLTTQAGSKTPNLPAFPKTVIARGAVVVPKIWIHRLAAEPFRLAWQEIVRRGLASRLRTFDGLWVPRHQLFNPSNPLSVHSWAGAIDFDARWNGYGVKPVIDREVVRILEEHGFVWGGRWDVPDGMHFQFTDVLPGTYRPHWQDAKGR